MKVKALCTVGRVSNLPTVWTNVLAAAILANSTFDMPWLWAGTLLALSLMYLGGMFLNDAFDVDWDRQNNNARPIVTGDISLSAVWSVGIVLIVVAVVLVALLHIVGNQNHQGLSAFYGLFGACALALTIVAYNLWHKQFAHSAFIMGGCRLGVYLIAALLLAQLNLIVVLAALSLLFYIAGLTYLARHEQQNRLARLWPLVLLFSPVILTLVVGELQPFYWLYLAGYVAWVVSRLALVIMNDKPNVKACIGGLLAAIPLLDGLMLASVGAVIPSLICLMVFFTIPFLHRWVSGT